MRVGVYVCMSHVFLNSFPPYYWNRVFHLGPEHDDVDSRASYLVPGKPCLSLLGTGITCQPSSYRLLESWALVIMAAQWIFYLLSHHTSCLSTSFFYYIYLLTLFLCMCGYLCACAYVYMDTCPPQCLCAVQRAVCGIWFSPSTIRVPKIKLMLAGLAASAFTWRAILLDFGLIFWGRVSQWTWSSPIWPD